MFTKILSLTNFCQHELYKSELKYQSKNIDNKYNLKADRYRQDVTKNQLIQSPVLGCLIHPKAS